MALFLIVIYIGALSFIFCYSFIQIHLVYNYRKACKKVCENKDTKGKENAFPMVTVQLPIYNELYVVKRLVDTVANLDYPVDKLEIQVLDDSTDDTVDVVKECVEKWQTKGIDIKQIRRINRAGFKAGALQEGLRSAKGDYIAIFDADFVPHTDFLKRTIPKFDSDKVGVVQTRWGHLNKDYSMLTKLQAFGLDAHFSVEQKGRNEGGYFINFNGTAGVWRKECIEDAGGWQSDTLTEDLDLSYRAQLKGWQFKFLEEVNAPAELPAEMNALKSQQYRWTKGAAETAKKNLGKVLRSELPFSTKLHACFHLMNSFIFVCVLLTALVSIPLLIMKNQYQFQYAYIFDIASIFLFGLLSLGIYYWSSLSRDYTRLSCRMRIFLARFPLFLCISMGLSLHNTIAVIEGYIGRKTPFVRTPKLNVNQSSDSWKENIYVIKKINPLSFLEALLAAYFTFGVVLSFHFKDFYLLLFHTFLAFGFASVAYYSIKHTKMA